MLMFPTPSDIDEMRANGYDVFTVARAEATYRAAEIVKREICVAFADVRLGEGIGLREAAAIERGATEWERAGQRKLDEQQDWQNIPRETLVRLGYGLGYLDAEGLRFHLPAYVLAAMACDAIPLTDYLLGWPDPQNRFDILKPDQRKAIGAYLELVADESFDPKVRSAIEFDLVHFWQRTP